jgi:hypothetical protein
MNRKTLISLAAVAALSVGFASAAKADPHVSFGFGIGGGGQPHFAIGVSDGGYGYPGYGYPGYGYYNAGYGDDCGFVWVKHKHWNWNHTYKIVTMKKQWVCN